MIRKGAGPWRRQLRRAAILLMLATMAAVLPFLPGFSLFYRQSIDLLLALEALAGRDPYPAQGAEVAVVVIDEETYATPPFRETPKVAWTPMLARVLDALAAGGARVLGLDLIYPTSLDRPGLLPGFDKPFLKVLYRLGRGGRLILGEARLSQRPIRPYPGQIVAVGGEENLSPLNLLLDADEVVRRYPVRFAMSDGSMVPSFAVALAGRVRPGSSIGRGDDFLIRFLRGAPSIPTYGLADIYACAGKGGEDFLRRHFAGKVVIVGTALDIEDRRIAATRFVPGNGAFRYAARCTPPGAGKSGALIERASIPGVFLHAAAVDTLLRRGELSLISAPAAGAMMAVGAIVLSALFFAVSPLSGVLGGVLVAVLMAAAAVLAFNANMVLPLMPLLVLPPLLFALIYAFRFIVEDRAKRRIRHAFSHYLAPSLVESLAERADLLRLGGERRRVTIWFSDIVGYTAISESLRDDPERLVDIINRYFTTIGACIEGRKGYIDKFIGDAVMAVWGAPLADDTAEVHAADAALDARVALQRFNEEVIRPQGLPLLETRIGINSGEAVVGNMGSLKRLNYTVTGDTVNLASRLEGANKTYGTFIMVGEETARRLRATHVLRRLDRLRVKGRNKPVRVYELIARRNGIDEARERDLEAFRAALVLYYRRRFDAAREAFSRIAERDGAAAVYAERCAVYAADPPPPDWDRTFTMTSK